MAELKCIVVTPEETALEQDTDFVVIPLYDGELGVGPSHSPMIGRLGFGELRLGRSSSERYYVDGGFVQVEGNVVSVLTNSLRRPGDIDRAAAEQQLEETKRMPVSTEEELTLRDDKVAQARAQVRISQSN